MEAKFETYPEYKDSGEEWLGEIPQRWGKLRMKFLFTDTSEKNRPNEELLSVTQDKGVIPRSWVENRMVMPSGALESFKFIQKGDFCISLRSFEGGLEYCHHDGIVSPAYTVLRKQKEVEEKYFRYLFKSSSFISEMQTSIVGIREGKNISYDELRYSLLPIPPNEEQITIADFLDDKVGKIDEAIAQKEQLIQLLTERKQIIIQNAVTKGLNPNAPMKDSGIEWIGQIPEHWELTSLKRFVQVQSGVTLNGTRSQGDDFPYLRVANVQDGYLDIESLKTIKIPSSEAKKYLLKKGDVIVTEGGDIDKLGRGAVWSGEISPCLHQNHVFAIRCRSTRLPNDYLSSILGAQYARRYFIETATKTTNLASTNKTHLKNFPVLLPPEDEQINILDYIVENTGKFDTAINHAQIAIKKLKEYKATLINSAVTGKINVFTHGH